MRKPSREELEKLDKDQLIDIILELFDRIEALEKKAARSATPFSKGKGKPEKKKPGRQKGRGRFTRRMEPEVLPGDRVEIIKVELEANACPDCGGTLERGTEVATIIDTPERPVRIIKRFEVQTGKCPQCGKTVRGKHPGLAADQYGATAHRVGINVIARSLALHYYSGATLRKSAEAIGMLGGIPLTPSALSQFTRKHCTGEGILAGIYRGLRREIATAPVVNTDDTGWRTGGRASYLMGFFTPQLAVFQVRERHRSEEVREMLGEDFDAILGTDRGTSYEAKEFDGLRQQKCLSHLLKNASTVEEIKKGRAKDFTRELKRILRDAIKIWRQYKEGTIKEKEFRRQGEEIDVKLTWHLRNRRLKDPDNQRLLDGIGGQHDKARVLLFLECPEVEPTNNRAERGLRPAVIARKVSQCSKNETGERQFETLKSITATLKLRSQDVAQGLADLLRGAPMTSPSASPS